MRDLVPHNKFGDGRGGHYWCPDEKGPVYLRKDVEAVTAALEAENEKLRAVLSAARTVLANHGGAVFEAPTDTQALAYAVGAFPEREEADHE